MTNFPPAGGQTPFWLLTAAVVFLLILNAGFIVLFLYIRRQFIGLRATVRNMITVAADDLARFENLVVRVNVDVRDQVSVKAEIPVKETLNVVVRGVIPVRETISTAAHVNTPLLGTKVPVNVSLPVVMNVPVDLNVPVVVDYSIPVDLTVPVQLTVPVEIDLRKTEVGARIDQALATVSSLNDLIGGDPL